MCLIAAVDDIRCTWRETLLQDNWVAHSRESKLLELSAAGKRAEKILRTGAGEDGNGDGEKIYSVCALVCNSRDGDNRELAVTRFDGGGDDHVAGFGHYIRPLVLSLVFM